MDFLFLLNEAVVLGNASESKFVHEINFKGVGHMFILFFVSLKELNTDAYTYFEGFDD